jgi:hypothetical protein
LQRHLKDEKTLFRGYQNIAYFHTSVPPKPSNESVSGLMPLKGK